MSVLIVEPKCTLVSSHATPWRVTVSMPTGQTKRRTDARPLLALCPRSDYINQTGDTDVSVRQWDCSRLLVIWRAPRGRCSRPKTPTFGSIIPTNHPCYQTFFYRRPRFRRCGRLCLEQASSRHQIRHIAVSRRRLKTRLFDNAYNCWLCNVVEVSRNSYHCDVM